MSKGLEALIRIEDLLNRLYETDVINDDHTHDTNVIEKELKRLEELEKAFDSLSKENEKVFKELSKEIEKNRKLQIIEKKFDVEVFEMKDLDDKTEYIIDIRPKQNKYSNMSGNSLTKEEYNLLKEVLL